MDVPRPPSGRRRWAVRVGLAGLLIALALLAVYSLSTQHAVVVQAGRTQAATRLASAYQDARFWVSQSESLERKYRAEPRAVVLSDHAHAGSSLVADLRRIAALGQSPSTRAEVARLLKVHTEYEAATGTMFAATRSGHVALARHLDHTVTDPLFSVLESAVYGGAYVAARDALHQSATLRRNESRAFDVDLIAIVIATALIAITGAVVLRYRRTIVAARRAELWRLSEMVVTDPLTGLRNHRAFHEDLAQELARMRRTGAPVSLAMLDVDGLKAVNDELGHQAGDEYLRTLARAIEATRRESDRCYRVGGDEFAVILPATGQWDAFQFAQRLNAVASDAPISPPRATAGISQALAEQSKDELIRDADLALINAKRAGQVAALYTPDMKPFAPSADLEEDAHHIRTLAGALALAVDAKDSYTHSHSQTVANLCTAIATELGLAPERLSWLRVAGLLHDVGKIGIPDAILQKPGTLDAREFEVMKTHAVLGESIILAAAMPQRARWVRHHHERIDGCGYPDGLAGEEIPLESRIIHVADAFEAMISDRPYRKAPGEVFAIGELRRNAGTQFDARVVEALLSVLGVSSLSELVAPRTTLATGSTRDAA